jgi:hypothetical protein
LRFPNGDAAPLPPRYLSFASESYDEHMGMDLIHYGDGRIHSIGFERKYKVEVFCSK